jgi:hypothetical protein
LSGLWDRYSFSESQQWERHSTVEVVLTELIDYVAASDPQEQLGLLLRSQGISGALLQARLLHYRRWADGHGARAKGVDIDTPAPPPAMAVGRGIQKPGLLAKLKGKVEQQHTPGVRNTPVAFDSLMAKHLNF